MKVNDLLSQPGEWLKGTGPEGDVVISSRIRLARNLRRFPFLPVATPTVRTEIEKFVRHKLENTKVPRALTYWSLGDLTAVERSLLVERHLISREHILRPECKSVIIGDKEIISIMVNEEDHLRIQIMQSGLNLMQGWRIADQLDDDLSKDLVFAYDKKWGYLTACPTNTGTGLRASVMLHLPALVMTKQINRVIQAITKLGMVVRGLYGEGTEAEGNLFQISNQITLGRSETEIVDHIEQIIRQLIGHEESARKQLLKQNQNILQDTICRALGTLRNAYIISSKETIHHLSMLRLGVDLGLVLEVDRKVVNELFLLTQPAHLQRMAGKLLAQSQRDATRAKIIRERLNRQ